MQALLLLFLFFNVSMNPLFASEQNMDTRDKNYIVNILKDINITTKRFQIVFGAVDESENNWSASLTAHFKTESKEPIVDIRVQLHDGRNDKDAFYPKEKVLELSWSLSGPEYEGQGYTSEVAQAVVEHLSQVLKNNDREIKSIIACPSTDNAASERIAQKSGMAYFATSNTNAKCYRKSL